MPKQDYDKTILAYVIGLAIGDGNLSNPNGRAVRLRITCDLKYPCLIEKIQRSIKILFPNNRVSIVGKSRSGNCIDISCYSNKWEGILGWEAKNGSKLKQKVTIPHWVTVKNEYSISCLRGLIETDGSICFDRGYTTVMFTSAIDRLAEDVYKMILSLNFIPRFYRIKNGYNNNYIYRIRLVKDSQKFLDLVMPEKS